MLIRIVKLHFKEDKINAFLSHFEKIKWKVSNFPGCKGMKLLQDNENPAIIFTFSSWENENALENYKNSQLFKELWPSIKIWFEDKPKAWSCHEYFDGFIKE